MIPAPSRAQEEGARVATGWKATFPLNLGSRKTRLSPPRSWTYSGILTLQYLPASHSALECMPSLGHLGRSLSLATFLSIAGETLWALGL